VPFFRRHDIQHNAAEHNDTRHGDAKKRRSRGIQHNDIQCDSQYEKFRYWYWVASCWVPQCIPPCWVSLYWVSLYWMSWHQFLDFFILKNDVLEKYLCGHFISFFFVVSWFISIAIAIASQERLRLVYTSDSICIFNFEFCLEGFLLTCVQCLGMCNKTLLRYRQKNESTPINSKKRATSIIPNK